MKLFYSLIISLLFVQTSTAQNIKVHLSGNIFGSGEDSIYVAQYFGTHYKNYAGVPLAKDGSFDLSCELPFPDYYVLRFGKSHVNVILRDNSDIKLYGDAKNIGKFLNVVGSDESAKLNEYLSIINDWKIKSDSANAVIATDPSKKDEVNKSMTLAYKQYIGRQQTFIAQNKNSAALYPALTQIDPSKDFKSYEAVAQQLVRAFPKSPSIQKIEENLGALQEEQAKNDPLGKGKLAPDFEEMMPDSTMMKLSDLRGKVVLLDFWASWCGPCRRENPNVVNMYNKYKDQGFTVMSVSLDRDYSRWIAAIEKDGLIWPNHVSDLKQWQSRVGSIYGVSSIPFTVLIDREGKIIGKNIRGAQLEVELARIFGE